ncbi:MAG TPA: hypothetical protein VJ888_06540, partial [Mobilitalea sp.]|nr:hypothetical protein [Mobilitalea sp.]
IFESKSGSIKIINDTDMNLEYVKVYFVDSEGPVSDPIEIKDFEAGDDIFQKLDEVDLLGKEANLEIRFKFKDYDKMLVDSGYFNDRFGGNIKIEFTQKDDEIVKLSVKASNGFIPSTLIQCDEVHDVYFKDGYIEE